MTLPNSDQLLLALLTEVNLDLRHWRDRNWATTRDALGAIFIIAGFSIFRSDAIWLATLAILGVCLASWIYLGKNFDRYRENVEARRRVEIALSLQTKDLYLKGLPLFPEEWNFSSPDKRGTDTFRLVIVGFGLLTIAAILMQSFDVAEQTHAACSEPRWIKCCAAGD